MLYQWVSLLPLLAYFVTSTSARSAFTTGYYVVTRFDTHAPSGRPENVNNITFSMDVTDPDPVANTNTTCVASWSASNGTYPSSWVSFARLFAPV
jgi:hypothetical protein